MKLPEVRCKCPPGYKFGSTTQSIEVVRPEHMKPSNGNQSFWIDICMVRFIHALWSMGIWTTGNCCGHGRFRPSFCLRENHHEWAREHFEELPGSPGCFYVPLPTEGANPAWEKES